MPQLRIMGDDGKHVDRVVALLLALIKGSPDLHAGDPTRLHHRGGGGRIVVDVSAVGNPPAADAADDEPTIRVERVDEPARRRPRPTGRALPPGKDSS